MTIDYSKWNNIDVSDSDEEERSSKQKSKPEVRTEARKVDTKIKPPPEAKGSKWNAGNYHWEEQKLDDWAKQRVREIFDKCTSQDVIEFQGARLAFVHVLGIDKQCDVEAWSHIRKGKTVVGFNVEMDLTVVGNVVAGPRNEKVQGALHIEAVVDAQPEVVFLKLEGIDNTNLRDLVKERIKCTCHEKIAIFGKELQDKALAQQQRREQLAQQQQQQQQQDQTAAETTTSTTSTSTTTTTSTHTPVSHFGGRVQVGGHNPQGLRIEPQK